MGHFSDCITLTAHDLVMLKWQLGYPADGYQVDISHPFCLRARQGDIPRQATPPLPVPALREAAVFIWLFHRVSSRSELLNETLHFPLETLAVGWERCILPLFSFKCD